MEGAVSNFGVDGDGYVQRQQQVAHEKKKEEGPLSLQPALPTLLGQAHCEEKKEKEKKEMLHDGGIAVEQQKRRPPRVHLPLRKDLDFFQQCHTFVRELAPKIERLGDTSQRSMAFHQSCREFVVELVGMVDGIDIYRMDAEVEQQVGT